MKLEQQNDFLQRLNMISRPPVDIKIGKLKIPFKRRAQKNRKEVPVVGDNEGGCLEKDKYKRVQKCCGEYYPASNRPTR